MDISTEESGLKNTRKHVVRGAIDLEGLKAFLARVYTSADAATSMHAVWDLRDVDFSTISDDTARSVMEFVSQHWGTDGSTRAAVVVSSDLVFSESQTYQSIMDGATSSSVAVFRRIGDAEKWIVAGE